MFGLLFLSPPSSGCFVRIYQFEFPICALPRDAWCIAGVGQQLQEKTATAVSDQNLEQYTIITVTITKASTVLNTMDNLSEI